MYKLVRNTQTYIHTYIITKVCHKEITTAKANTKHNRIINLDNMLGASVRVCVCFLVCVLILKKSFESDVPYLEFVFSLELMQ